jgi:hypothetical protein
MSKSEYLKESFPRIYKNPDPKHNAAKPNTRKFGCDQQENPEKGGRKGRMEMKWK